MVRLPKSYFFQQRQVNLSLLLSFGLLAMFAVVWFLILPNNFSKRRDIKKVIKTTSIHQKYNVNVLIPLQSNAFESINGQVTSSNSANLTLIQNFGENEMSAIRVPIKIWDGRIRGYEELLNFGTNMSNRYAKNTKLTLKDETEFIESLNTILDPVGYLTNGLKADEIGKTRINGKVNRWFRITISHDGRSDDLRKAFMVVTRNAFSGKDMVSYDILFGEENQLINSVIINYRDGNRPIKIKVDFNYAK